MHLIRIRILTFCSLLSLLVIGCGSESSNLDEIILSGDAHLLAFYLSSDSIPELSSTTFSVDQREGKIYNHDSLAYQTTFDHKVRFLFTKGNSDATVNFRDTTITSGDTIEIFQNVMQLTVVAPDGLRTKQYELKINIHQADPDSITYKSFATDLAALKADITNTLAFKDAYYLFTKTGSTLSLYESTDLIDWTSKSLGNLPAEARTGVVVRQIVAGNEYLLLHTEAGELYQSADLAEWTLVESPKVLAILGLLHESSIQRPTVAMIIEQDGIPAFAAYEGYSDWNYGAAIPGNFPVADFAAVSYGRMNTQRISIIGGKSLEAEVLNAVWSTENGYYWAKMNPDSESLPVLKNHNAFIYDGRIYVMNGENNSGSVNSAVYSSVDGGITWETMPNKYLFPAEYQARYSASVIVDDDAFYFYIIGGRGASIYTDIWSGVRNGLLFDN